MMYDIDLIRKKKNVVDDAMQFLLRVSRLSI